MATPLYQKQPLADTLVVNGDYVVATWVPCGTNPFTGATFCGANSTSSVPKGLGFLCTAESLANMPMANLTSEEIRSMGKASYMFSTGAKIDPFDLTLEGGDVRSLQIIAGQDPSGSGINTFTALPDMGVLGHLIVRKFARNGTGMISSYCIPNLSVRFDELALGGAPGERGLQTLKLYKPGDGENYVAAGNKSFTVDFWADHSINSNAPDGTITDLVLGTGNYNGTAGSAASAAVLLNDDLIGSTSSNYRRYFIGVWVDGVLQTDSQVSYTTGTRTLTFATAPANGARVLAIYVSDWSSVTPTAWTNSPTTTVKENEKYPWYQYA